MTENEAIKYIQRDIYFINKMIEHDKRFDPKADMNRYLKAKTAYETAISALEEVQQYREIGTVEECQKAMEKLPDAEDTIRKLMCGEYGSSCQFCIYDNDEDAMCCNIGGSGSWCCENARWKGKSE